MQRKQLKIQPRREIGVPGAHSKIAQLVIVFGAGDVLFDGVVTAQVIFTV